MKKLLELFTGLPIFARRAILITGLVCFLLYTLAYLYVSIGKDEFAPFLAPFKLF